MRAETVYTIGHSTRPLDEFVALLRAHGVVKLADVRTIPRSRHNPQFEGAALERSLAQAGIEYRWWRALGGLRHARADSPNGAWRNASFRGFADYMQTQAFADALEELIVAGRGDDLAIMCAEAVPWRCHRSLIGDALLVRGVTVLDIMSRERATPHRLTPFAVVDGLTITYPATDAV